MSRKREKFFRVENDGFSAGGLGVVYLCERCKVVSLPESGRE